MVGAVLAIPLSFLTASNLVPGPIAFVGRMAIMAIRTVPSLVYGLMFVRVTGMGAFAGLMTMALSSIGMVSKMYIEAIEDLDVKNRWMPQAVPPSRRSGTAFCPSSFPTLHPLPSIALTSTSGTPLSWVWWVQAAMAHR